MHVAEFEETYLCPCCSMACFINVKVEVVNGEFLIKSMDGFRCGRGKNYAAMEALEAAKKSEQLRKNE